MLHSARWFLASILCSCLTYSVISFNTHSTPTYSVINVEDELLQDSEISDHELPQVSRRGYAGDDFYQKASKSIPRMGRRSELNPTTNEMWHDDVLTNSMDAGQLLLDENGSVKRKRLNLRHDGLDGFPWYSDRVPNLTFKRNEINEQCYYSPKRKNYISSDEICDENMICCPIMQDSSIFKRILSSRSSKQTATSAPDYKSNQFM